MPSREANIAELSSPAEDHARRKHMPQLLPASQPQTYDWSGWERWLKGHLDIERETLHRALVKLCTARSASCWQQNAGSSAINLSERRERSKSSSRSLSVDILRGAQPPPPAKFPTVKAWKEDVIYYEGDIVAFAGGGGNSRRRAPVFIA
jgi:hypothetical protein